MYTIYTIDLTEVVFDVITNFGFFSHLLELYIPRRRKLWIILLNCPGGGAIFVGGFLRAVESNYVNDKSRIAPSITLICCFYLIFLLINCHSRK